MIKDISEKEYRAIPRDSSSSLKDFSTDRRKYHKRFILGDKKADENKDDSHAVMMGRLVETLLMEPDKFDDQFYMSSIVTVPSGLMGDFASALARFTVEATNEDGVVTKDFMELAESNFKLVLETVVGKFLGSDAEIYYNERRVVDYNNLTVITANDVNNAERIVQELKQNPITSTIVNLETSRRFEVLNQLKISDFEIDNFPLKSMLDKVIVDHTDRTIQFFDLKCTWNVENFYRDYYLKLRAYIQAKVYYEAIIALTKDKDSPFYNYKPLNPKFIVCDSINYYSPLIYEVSDKDLQDAYNGFEVRGYKYPGVKTIIEELKWAVEIDKWNISKKNFLMYWI